LRRASKAKKPPPGAERGFESLTYYNVIRRPGLGITDIEDAGVMAEVKSKGLESAQITWYRDCMTEHGQSE
jgi:hypothetical protein